MALSRKQSAQRDASTEASKPNAAANANEGSARAEPSPSRADAVEPAPSRRLPAALENADDSRTQRDERPNNAESSTSADAAAARKKSIAERAYFKAEQRGFTPGHEEADWLDAEHEEDRDSGAGPQ